MIPELWPGKRVFLTGHTGFKGAWLALWLQQMGATVRGLALDPPTDPSMFVLTECGGAMDDVRGDVRDATLVQSTMAAFAPNVVFHMAAQALVRPSYTDPLGTYATNVMGTAHVLDAVRTVPSVRAVIVITSDKCYENREWERGYVEEDAMGGYDPYSSSKGCAELVTSAYRRSYFHPEKYAQHGVSVASVRAGNVIGGGDWATDRLIPDAMRAFLAGKPFVVRNPGAIRPWQHVLEPLSGYLAVAEQMLAAGPAFAGAWNFGPAPASEQPVQYIAEKITSLWGDGRQWLIASDANAPHEAHFLKLNAAKAHDRLGWSPVLSLDEALAFTVKWFKAFAEGRDIRTFSLDQIAQYSAASAK